MYVLVINCGSSSLKYQLINTEDENVLAKGICERIGDVGSAITHQAGEDKKVKEEVDMPDHTVAIKLVTDKLTNSKVGVIKSLDEIQAVGHRIVHGGDKFLSTTILTQKAIEDFSNAMDWAPLHNPAHLAGVLSCKAVMPNIPNIAVFDTSFHMTMPLKAYLYALPYEYYENYAIRRYGAHGTSHDYVSARSAEILGKDRKDLKIIVCHLGNGASISAVKNGKCIDTSMGLTPLEGLVMGTRSGDIDPAIMQFLARKENIGIDEIMDILNKKSGVLGISGLSSDFRDLEAALYEGNERAKAAIEVFTYRVAKYIGAYTAAMNGVDIIAFSAGVGENGPLVRKMMCEYLQYLGVEIDDEKNKVHGDECIISTKNSKVSVMVVPTNEEVAIAREVVQILK